MIEKWDQGAEGSGHNVSDCEKSAEMKASCFHFAVGHHGDHMQHDKSNDQTEASVMLVSACSTLAAVLYAIGVIWLIVQVARTLVYTAGCEDQGKRCFHLEGKQGRARLGPQWAAVSRDPPNCHCLQLARFPMPQAEYQQVCLSNSSSTLGPSFSFPDIAHALLERTSCLYRIPIDHALELPREQPKSLDTIS